MDIKNEHPHLWIPDEEVINVENIVTARTINVPVDFSEHGVKLINGLSAIDSFHKRKESPISNEYIIFKVRLYPNQKFSNKSRKDFLEKNGLEVKFIKDNETAIVASSLNKFDLLKKKTSNYQEKNKYSDFQYIDSFEYVGRNEKQSGYLRKQLDENKEEMIDIQIQLLPNFSDLTYEKSISYISSLIEAGNGELIDEPFYLSDNTPVIRALVESSMIDVISEEEIVFSIENTVFFSSTPSDGSNNLRFDDVTLDPNIVLDNIPVIGILDSGVNFENSLLNNFVIHRYVSDGITKTNFYHGTGCAFRSMFGNDFIIQKSKGFVSPKVRVVDGIISNGTDKIPTALFIDRIRKSIQNLKQYTKIFNLSFNSSIPIDGDTMSIVGYELDCIMRDENVQIVISSGNHQLYRVYNNLNDIIDDDDSRIAPPADSALGLSVGSYCIEHNSSSVSQKFDISPYSRIGFGLGGSLKPDLVAPGGNIYYDITTSKDVVPLSDSALIPIKTGELIADCGTSYASPIVTSDLAIIQKYLPGNLTFNGESTLMAKTLLLHTATHFSDFDQLDSFEKDAIRRVYGNGYTNLGSAMFSSNNRVTFVRTGSMNYLNKQRVKFYMPSNLAGQDGMRTCRVTVTCVSNVPFRRDKGTEYIGAYIGASLKKIDTKSQLKVGNPKNCDGRDEWSVYQHFSNVFSSFNPGDWQIWLQMHKRWDMSKEEDIEYALAVTIEDLTQSNNIYEAILLETENRFRPLNELRVRL